jgi:hypothetical protein
MKPNFQAMSLSELRAYVLEHREDEAAFHALVDCYKADYPNRVSYPAPKTPEDFQEIGRVLRERLGR